MSHIFPRLLDNLCYRFWLSGKFNTWMRRDCESVKLKSIIRGKENLYKIWLHFTVPWFVAARHKLMLMYCQPDQEKIFNEIGIKISYFLSGTYQSNWLLQNARHVVQDLCVLIFIRLLPCRIWRSTPTSTAHVASVRSKHFPKLFSNKLSTGKWGHIIYQPPIWVNRISIFIKC